MPTTDRRPSAVQRSTPGGFNKDHRPDPFPEFDTDGTGRATISYIPEAAPRTSGAGMERYNNKFSTLPRAARWAPAFHHDRPCRQAQ
jgi:hypothetical protein